MEKIGLLFTPTFGHTGLSFHCKAGSLIRRNKIVGQYLAQFQGQVIILYIRIRMSQLLLPKVYLLLVFKNGPFQASFFFIFVFSIQLTVNKCSINFADDWSRTADLWYRKRPLYQLSHTTTAQLVACLLARDCQRFTCCLLPKVYLFGQILIGQTGNHSCLCTRWQNIILFFRHRK